MQRGSVSYPILLWKMEIIAFLIPTILALCLYIVVTHAFE